MSLNVNEINFKELTPYIVNLKSIVGIALIGFSLYSAFTDLPTKWSNYWAKTNANAELVKNKTELIVEKSKLQVISKELDKLSTKILEIQAGNAPQLEAIKTAQKVITVCEATKNIYMGLEPGPSTVLNVTSSVTLPIQMPTMSPSAGMSTSGSTPTMPSIATASAPNAPGANPAGQVGGKTTTSTTDLNAFQYTLTLKGSYINLAHFIHDLAQLPDFIVLNDVHMTQAKDSNTPVPSKGTAPADVEMKLDFSVPWK